MVIINNKYLNIFYFYILVSLASDVESRSLYKDKPLRVEQTEKPPLPPQQQGKFHNISHKTIIIYH